MYNSQKIANRIRSTAKQQGKSLGEVLSNCELGKNTVSKIEKGNDILTLNFAKIADYLDCSVDYLLGRTDSPEIAGGIHISSGNGNVIAGGNANNITISNGSQKPDKDKEDMELMELIKSLPLKKRVKIISMIYEELEG